MTPSTKLLIKVFLCSISFVNPPPTPHLFRTRLVVQRDFHREGATCAFSFGGCPDFAAMGFHDLFGDEEAEAGASLIIFIESLEGCAKKAVTECSSTGVLLMSYTCLILDTI